RAGRAHHGGPAGDHEVRPAVGRRGRPAPGRARPVAAHAGLGLGPVMQATPKRGRRLGGSSSHQKAMLGNLVASLIAAESIVTTEAKAKAMRPVAEKVITKAKKAEANPDSKLHQIRQVQSYLGDREMTA